MTGAQVFLKTVTIATMKPPTAPPIIHGMIAPGFSGAYCSHVNTDVATSTSSSNPVLLTVPPRVITLLPPVTTLPLPTSREKVFLFRAGLPLRIGGLRWNEDCGDASRPGSGRPPRP